MGREDPTAPFTAIGVSLASSVADNLSTFDIAALRRDFERLSVDDLTALASFPAEPHELIGRVVAVTHCLLLSLSPEHTALELRAPPWPLLRLQLLEDTRKIWRKLRKRAWQLETGVKALSPVQLRFGCKELLAFILPVKHQSRRYHGAWQLEKLARVSTIAASLGAWVVFCLCCSVPSPESHEGAIAIQPPPGVKLSPRFHLPRQRIPQENGAISPPKFVKNTGAPQLKPLTCRSSRRIGIKIGGRLLLFHARFPSYSSSQVSTIDTLGERSAYCLAANRMGRRMEHANSSSPLNAWWKPFHDFETQCSRKIPVVLSRLTPLAQRSLLLQLGFHEQTFERPAQDIPHLRTPRSFPLVLTLKFDVVAVDSKSQLSLLGVGNVWTTMGTTVADLRLQLTSAIASRLLNTVDQQINFRFLYRASLLAVSQEKHLAAVALLPFAMLLVNNLNGRHYRPSQLWRHQCEVAQSLVNAGLPDNIPKTCQGPVLGTTTFAPQVFAMRQPFTSPAADHSSNTRKASTCSVIVEMFTHWQAFVAFQQLQDSSVLFQLPQRSPKQKLAHKLPIQRRNNGHEEESEPYGPHPMPLPRKKFNCKKEWLLPLYAVVDVASPTTAVLKTPFQQDVERILASPCRLVLAEEASVIHFTRLNSVTSERDALGTNLTVFDIAFLRDESCSLESLIQLRGAYVWLVVPRKPHGNPQVPPLPTEWMIDLYRFVLHPTFDFQSSSCPQVNHFRVNLPCDVAERAVEAAFWSKGVDWAPSVSSTDLYATVLRKIFDALCRSHPPAFGVDSVKFGKLLYEARIQPALLSIGDAAFLFASNLTPGFTYEMDFDGFVRAIEWLAQQFFSEGGKKSPSKTVAGTQHAMTKWQLSRRGERETRGRLASSLRRFCYETLVHLPSLTSTWHSIMDSWRLERKRQLIQEYTQQYCAATRLRASWIGFITWRIFLQRRERMREERLAATKLQRIARGRKDYLAYHRVRRIVTRTQLQIHARFELRRLRAERAAFIERTRIRMVRWMRHHLWLLREWKRLNAEKAARRDRIREKRLRRLGVAVLPLDTWRVRCSLYRAKPDSAVNGNASNEAYELEVVDPVRSWGHVFCVSQQQLDQFAAEEADRQARQLQSGLSATVNPVKRLPQSSVSAVIMQSKLPRGRTHVNSSLARDSVAYPELKPNVLLLAVARRLYILHDAQRNPSALRCYSDPADTSLGKLVFKGAVRSEVVQEGIQGEMLVQRHVIRVLEWAGAFKFLTYTPATSVRRRYDLDASFLLSVLQFSRFQSMRLSVLEADDVLDEDKEELARASTSKPLETGDQSPIPFHIHRVLTGSHKVLALQRILSYVMKYGVRTPTYAMMPHVVAERGRQRKERESEQRNALLTRERQLIVKVQARFRRCIARRTRLQLALISYRKEFDRDSGQFVYVRLNGAGTRAVLGEKKPSSLFDQDVPLPPDEWQLVPASDNGLRFLNPHRGVYSRYNEILAAALIQKWFRGTMWNGINDWKLQNIARALHYHSDVQKPSNMADSEQLENLKRYGLQLHVLQHQYKAAFSVYEAALKLSPDDPQTLALMATLLVISCRYPVAQSWQRAMTLLQQARDLAGDDFVSRLHDLEQNGFRWALFLQPKNPHAIANYAVYLQCVHLDINKDQEMALCLLEAIALQVPRPSPRSMKLLRIAPSLTTATSSSLTRHFAGAATTATASGHRSTTTTSTPFFIEFYRACGGAMYLSDEL